CMVGAFRGGRPRCRAPPARTSEQVPRFRLLPREASQDPLSHRRGSEARSSSRPRLHLGPTTVRRMQQDTRWPEPRKVPQSGRRGVSAKEPNQLWHVDLTTVPTALGLWVSWLPFALPQAWPFCWWLVVAVDHFSRRTMGFAVYRSLPSSAAVRRYFEGAFRRAGNRPAHIVYDQRTQITEKRFRLLR